MRKLMLAKGISLVLALLLTLMGVGALALAEEADDLFTTDEIWEAEEVFEEEAEKPVYTLIFLDYADEVLVEEKLSEGDRIVRPFFVPTRDGYNFLFWYSVQELELTKEIVEFEFGNGIEGDTLLKPFYEEIVVEEEPLPVAEEDEPETVILPWEGEAETSEPEIDDEDVIESGNDLDIVIIDDPVYDEVADEEVADEEIVDEDETANDNETTADETDEQSEDSPALAANYAINVFSSHSENIEEGEILRVWAELEGFTAEEAEMQWQYSADGLSWNDVQGATDLEYAFEANSESVNYSWRLLAKIAMGEE